MIEHVRIMADWLDDAGYGVNVRLHGTQMYLCTDANAAADAQLLGTTTVSGVGTVDVTCRVQAGTSTQSVITYYRNSDGIAIITATITWAAGVPSVAMTTGTLVSSTAVDGAGLYELVLRGTAVAADTHMLLVKIANAVVATSTGTVYFGGWSLTNAAFSFGDTADMTTWASAFGATVVAVAGAVDIDGGDSVPGPVTVYDDSRDAIIARKRWPQDLATTRGLIVHDLGTQWRVGIQNGYQEGVCRVGILLVLPVAATDEAVEDCGYIMRAVRMSLNDLSDPAQEASRTRNGIILTNPTEVEEPPPETEIADVMVMAAAQWTWSVRDTAP